MVTLLTNGEAARPEAGSSRRGGGVPDHRPPTTEPPAAQTTGGTGGPVVFGGGDPPLPLSENEAVDLGVPLQKPDGPRLSTQGGGPRPPAPTTGGVNPVGFLSFRGDFRKN